MGPLILDCESEYHIIVTNVKKTLQGAVVQFGLYTTLSS
jgi:hypothetical protein